jgi:prepilin-type N-terminal cleavage/methylation domain-containing protein
VTSRTDVGHRMTARTIARRGFTLVELLLSLIVTAIVGAALIRMVLGQTRFMEQQEAWRGARAVARGGVNRLFSDLRVVEATNGVTAAVAGGQDFTVRVPYAFGIICSMPSANSAILSMLPVDSAMYNAPGYRGFAIRAESGTYTTYTSNVLNTPPPAVAAPTACSAPTAPDLPIWVNLTVNGSPAGKRIQVTAAAASFAPTPKKGQIVYLYRRIRYQFKNSTALPGRTGLFRAALDGGAEEEIATPFAASARVNFYVLNTTAAQAAVPASLADIRGFELVLDGMSERTPQGSAAPKTASVRTSVFFENRPD